MDGFIKNKIENPEYVEVYEKIIKPIVINYIDNDKTVAEFMLKLFDINTDQYTKSVICFIIEKIYLKMYKVLGYQNYQTHLFVKKL